jgi:hypothetical protein
MRGPVAQWITRLPTEQKIAGSIPAWIGFFSLFLNLKIGKQTAALIYRLKITLNKTNDLFRKIRLLKWNSNLCHLSFAKRKEGHFSLNIFSFVLLKRANKLFAIFLKPTKS